ncbi:MAG: YicC family protein [Candidatus Firestonebacteria bacterium]|nr:YicC family protein [Candidatus Firestonebacteria bacterium]
MKSMTGFGRGKNESGNIKYAVEISSVNHKYFDINYRMSSQLLQFQERIKELLRKELDRGRIDVAVIILEGYKNQRVSINHHLAKEYLRSVAELKKNLNIKGEITIADVLRLPEIFRVYEEKQVGWEQIKEALEKALLMFIKAREREGGRIKKDFIARINTLKKLLEGIEKTNHKAKGDNKKRIEDKVKNNYKDIKMDQGRVYTEVSLMVEKSDISEEITRIKSHINEFYHIINSKGTKGRKLDFLVQEFLREINTIGSKCSNSAVSHMVVSFKEELEKIREQVQNVE